ncbi:MAG TPA: nuclear transport factor 2 family protein [Clostridia bacterium]
MEHENLETINKFFEAYSRHDQEGIKKVLDENAKWIFPGRNPFSGTKEGVEEIIAFFDKMGEFIGRFKAKSQSLITGVNENYIVEGQYIYLNGENGAELEHHWCVLWKFEGGKITEGKHFAEDQYKVDEFFTTHFK